MNTLLERMGIPVPQYHNTKAAHFYIEIEPVSLWRKLKFWPYFVGNRVKYRLRIIDVESRKDATMLHLFEVFAGEDKRIRKFEPGEIDGNWNEITGNPIDREGDVIHKIGTSPKSAVAATIFSTHVINTDRWLLGCIGLIIGGLISFVVTIVAGVILGFIDVRPFWGIWIP